MSFFLPLCTNEQHICDSFLTQTKRWVLLSHYLGLVRASTTSSFKLILITNIQFILMLGKIFESCGSLFPNSIKRWVFSFLEYKITSYQDPKGRAWVLLKQKNNLIFEVSLGSRKHSVESVCGESKLTSGCTSKYLTWCAWMVSPGF